MLARWPGPGCLPVCGSGKQAEGWHLCGGKASLSVASCNCYFVTEEHVLLILGIIKESGAKHKGLIEIPNLSEENEVEDTEVKYLLPFL